MKKRVLKIVIIALSVYAVFAVIVVVLFNSVRNNPIDQIAMPYIWSNTEIPAEYGEIISVGRMVAMEKEETETLIKVPYSVYTETNRIIVYVTLSKSEEDLVPISLEIVEILDESYYERDI